MKLLYCWRCQALVPMMNEREFARVELAYRRAIQAIRSFRRRRDATLGQTPTARLYSPVQALYRELTQKAQLKPVRVAPDHVLKHRLATYGPPCKTCGLPLRTPAANVCAACGAERAA